MALLTISLSCLEQPIKYITSNELTSVIDTIIIKWEKQFNSKKCNNIYGISEDRTETDTTFKYTSFMNFLIGNPTIFLNIKSLTNSQTTENITATIKTESAGYPNLKSI